MAISASQVKSIVDTIASDPRQLIGYISMITGKRYVYTRPFPAYLTSLDKAKTIIGSKPASAEDIGGFVVFIQEDDGSGRVNLNTNHRLAIGVFIGKDGFKPEGKTINDLANEIKKNAARTELPDPTELLNRVMSSPSVAELIGGTYDESVIGRAIGEILRAINDIGTEKLIEFVGEGAEIHLPDAGYLYPDVVVVKLKNGWFAFAPLNDLGYDFTEGLVEALRGQPSA